MTLKKPPTPVGEPVDAWLDDLLASAPPVEPSDPGPQAEFEPEEEPSAWRNKLLVSKEGAIKSCVANALTIAREHPLLAGKLRWNERAQVAEWSSPPPWAKEPRPITDADSVEAAKWIGETETSAVSDSFFASAFLAEAHRRSYDPVRDYLESLEWDGTPRVDGWMASYLGAEDSPYARAVGLAWLVSAAARTYQPGCKADHMIVLEGAQGIGKSSAISALAGPWYAEVSIDTREKDSALSLHGPWIVEWAELAGLTTREAEATKAFLSRQKDWLRPPYGRCHVSMLRRCVIAGSTNESVYVNDHSGNRRYWPVSCGETGKLDPTGIAHDRDRLWAEVVQWYRDGEHWWLSPENEEIARLEQEKRRESDTWEGIIAFRLIGETRITVRAIVEALDLPSSAQNAGSSRRITRAMRRLGWSPARIDGAPGYERIEELI